MSVLKSFSQDWAPVLSDVLLYEIDRSYSRGEVVLAATAEALPIGAVVVPDTNGEYIPYTAASTTDPAVLITPLEASDEDQVGIAIQRGARVSAANLVFTDDITDSQKTAAFAKLTALGIVTQE